jgi:purine-binding chemotaxis protein CheW
MITTYDNVQLRDTTRSFLSFKLGNEHFAIDVLRIMEILEMPRITKVPQASEHLLGVVNLRGRALPVIDARLRFGFNPMETTVNTCILVLNVSMNDGFLTVGALVDSVSKVFDVDENQIQPSPVIGASYKADFIKGMIREKDQFMMLLDVDKVFPTDEMAAVKESHEEPVIQ